MKPRFFKSGDDFRRWLDTNHASKTELWVGFYKKGARKTGITLAEAQEQALCFGWIDGHMRSIDTETMMLRFTPRKPKSNWSRINIERVDKLKKAGLMTPAGLEAFERRVAAHYSFEEAPKTLAPPYAKRFKANKKAWSFFESQAPSYQRTIIHWVMSAKQDATKERRLEQAIATSARGERLSQFHRPAKKT